MFIKDGNKSFEHLTTSAGDLAQGYLRCQLTPKMALLVFNWMRIDCVEKLGQHSQRFGKGLF